MSRPAFVFPAEWEPHESTWLSWPHSAETWPDGRLPRVQSVFRAFIRTIAQGEDVHLSVPDSETVEWLAADLRQEGAPMHRIHLHVFPTNDAWCRDHGPSFVFEKESGTKTIVNWGFNSWGGKYPFALDNQIPRLAAEALQLPLVDPGLIMEGGSIEVNGAGCLLTTTACLLNPNRNPGHTREAIEAALRRYYGAQQIVWLGDGIAGDDTDGHVDDMTRFVGESKIVTAVERDSNDANFEPLRENLARLRAVRLPGGRALDIAELPMPQPVFADGMRLPASYANFYIANAAVILPTFGCPQDAEALDILQACFDRPVVGLDARDVVFGLGTFHCLSQQEPAAAMTSPRNQGM